MAAILMIAVGAVLLVPHLQTRFATAAGPVANWTEHRFGKFSTAGVGGQFGVGLLMGAVRRANAWRCFADGCSR